MNIKKVFLIGILLILTGCTDKKNEQANKESTQQTEISSSQSSSSTQTTKKQDESSTQASKEEKTEMNRLVIKIGNKEFTGTFIDNETSKAFKDSLPLTLDMGELNGNEKFYYFSESLPTTSERVHSINNGDLMLFGSDCLVLFYKNFSSSYSYSRIATLDNPSGLAEVLGRSNATVSFELQE